MSKHTTEVISSWKDAPIWWVGFRPFFILAVLAAISLPLLWAFHLQGSGVTLVTGLMPMQWHAHEMLFGFGWAVLGGFLLTASKNWVNIRGMHGVALAVAALLWCAERIVIWCYPADIANSLALRALAGVGSSLFLLFVGGYVLFTLVRYRQQDSFKDNYFFIIALPLFLLAKQLLLNPSTYAEGVALTIGLFRLAFTVMFERTITQFMKNACGITLPRHAWLDTTIKVSVLLSALQGFYAPTMAAVITAVAGGLLLYRWCLWSPHIGLARFDTGTMYVGYLCLILHLLLEAVRNATDYVFASSISLHVFAFGCMGVVIPAMMLRISQGHTGRKVEFLRIDRIALTCMGIGAFFRLVATQLWPTLYTHLIVVAAIAWALCFLLIAVRILRFLWQPRIDGRVH